MTVQTAVDLRPFMDGVVFPMLEAVLTPLVTGAAGWALYHLGKLAHVTVTQAQSLAVENAMQKGLTYALSVAHKDADDRGMITPKDALVANAANYVLPKIPAYLAALGITPQGLAERIEARLPADFKAISPPAAVS